MRRSVGAPLPSQLEFRELYRVSRNTVQDTVKWLVTRGLVITRPGQKLTDGSTVVSRHQQRFIDGAPWSLQTSFYPIPVGKVPPPAD